MLSQSVCISWSGLMQNKYSLSPCHFTFWLNFYFHISVSTGASPCILYFFVFVFFHSGNQKFKIQSNNKTCKLFMTILNIEQVCVIRCRTGEHIAKAVIFIFILTFISQQSWTCSVSSSFMCFQTTIPAYVVLNTYRTSCYIGNLELVMS